MEAWEPSGRVGAERTMINISSPQAGVGTGAKERINKWPLEIKTVMDEGHSRHDSSLVKNRAITATQPPRSHTSPGLTHMNVIITPWPSPRQPAPVSNDPK